LLRQGWKMIEKNQAKMFHVVTDMLSYSKEREPASEETDLNARVREVVELLAPRAAENKVQLEAKYDNRLPICLADPDALYHAALNIAGNALDAVESAETPRVTVSTVLADSDWAEIHIADNGTGIAPEKLADIFRPFVSTKGSRGTGLGLAVSRKILREHGGDITVRSQPGQGSTFILRLPLRPVQPLDMTLTQTVPPPADS